MNPSHSLLAYDYACDTKTKEEEKLSKVQQGKRRGVCSGFVKRSEFQVPAALLLITLSSVAATSLFFDSRRMIKKRTQLCISVVQQNAQQILIHSTRSSRIFVPRQRLSTADEAEAWLRGQSSTAKQRVRPLLQAYCRSSRAKATGLTLQTSRRSAASVTRYLVLMPDACP